MQRLTLLVALASLALGVSGCTGGSAGPCDAVAADNPDATVIKILPSFEFGPEDATVSLGDDGEATVIWCNEGGAHNVHESEGLFQSDVSSAQGLHFEYTFTEEGTFDYWCDPHKGQGMTGSVTVTA